MQIVWVLDSTELQTASGGGLQQRNRFMRIWMLGGGRSPSWFYCKCMCGCVWVDAWQWGYVWACLSLNMTGICRCKHLGAGSRRECMLTIVKLWVFWLRIPFNTRENLDSRKPGAVMHFQERHLSYALYLTATAAHWATSLHHSLIHGHSSPFLQPIHFPPPLFSTPAPPIMDDPGWWWLHQGQFQMHYS